jgi:hypothetical protein
MDDDDGENTQKERVDDERKLVNVCCNGQCVNMNDEK